MKPLQDRGVKVLLGILGNHDRAGLANLSDEAAVLFAQECKATCDAYNLDGLFFDDEYSNYSKVYPGFVQASNAAASRLFYEIKKAQPHRINAIYHCGRMGGQPVTDLETGEVFEGGDYMDFALADYGAKSDFSRLYVGMTKDRMGAYSQEFALGKFQWEPQLRDMVNDGYGCHMIFSLDPAAKLQGVIEAALNACAIVFYNDEMVYDGNPQPADWK